LTSKRGRQRINTEINALKELIPECRDVGCHKAFVLESAVATLKKLIAQNEQLQNENVRLQQEVHVRKNSSLVAVLSLSHPFI